MSYGFSLPRLRPLLSRRSTLVSVLDVGTSKVVCLVAELAVADSGQAARGRTHLAEVIGIGQHRSAGLKGGIVVDLDAAEASIRQAVAAAERMAGVEIGSVIVNLNGGRLAAGISAAEIEIGGAPVAERDVARVLRAAGSRQPRPGRAVLHAVATGFSLDAGSRVVEPVGMVGERLGGDLTVVTAEQSAVRNLMLAVERCHLAVEAVVASPYAAGLSVLVDDESEMGAVVLDLGAGTTTLAVFQGGHLVHVDGVAVGGNHVTMDLARGLTLRMSDAERLKASYGAAVGSGSDDREMVMVPRVDEDERDAPGQVPRSHLVRIIRPRIEEVLELVRDRLDNAGFGAQAGRQVVLTGGASQLGGLTEAARRILAGQVRIGRPPGLGGLPDAARGPAYAATVGLVLYPAVAQAEHVEPSAGGSLGRGEGIGYLSRVGRWIRESF